MRRRMELIVSSSDLFLPCFVWMVMVAVSEASITITPEYNHAEKVGEHPFFIPGSSLTLTCVTSEVGASLNWTHTPNRGDTPQIVVQGISGSALIRHRLTPDHAGNYTCSDGSGASGWYFVNVLHADALQPLPQTVLTNGTLPVVHLHCEQRFHPAFPLKWTYHGEPLHNNTEPNQHRHYTLASAEHKYDLEIRSYFPDGDKKVHRFPLKTGEYECELDTTGTGVKLSQPIKKQVTYESTPDVRMDGGPVSREATKGSLFTITCVYAGRHDDRPVKWAVNVTSRDTLWSALSLEQQQQQLIGWRPLLEENDLVRPCPATGHPDRQCVSGRERYTFTRDYALENASAELHERTSVLEIHDVEDGDRGAYYCMVGNEHGWNNATVFVRIKDRYAALWPFLGIVAEVVILAFLICVCERRRSRQLQREQQDEEAKPLHATQNEHERSTLPADSVRNRK